MKHLALIALIVVPTLLTAQTFPADIGQALKAHEDSNGAPAQLEGLEMMEKVAKKYPKEWLPNFWASYQCTQMAMLKDREDYPKQLNPNELLDRADKYWKQANKLADDKMSDELKADFHALRSLIYTFRMINTDDSEKSGEYKSLGDEQIKTAASLNPESPVVMVFAATNLARDDDANYADLIAAAQLMKLARKQFEQAPERSMTTNFNQEWIQFWLPWVEGRIEKLTGS